MPAIVMWFHLLSYIDRTHSLTHAISHGQNYVIISNICGINNPDSVQNMLLFRERKETRELIVNAICR